MQDNFKNNIPKIEKKIGYVFKDKSLLKQAFTRTSYCNEHTAGGEALQSNEVLEFFGDTVLSLSIVTFLMKECSKRYAFGLKTKLNEGNFSNIKSKLSDKKNLSESMKALGLERYLLMGEGDVKLEVQNEPSVMEDLFESIVGAIYIDSDMNIPAVMRSVSGMLNLAEYLNSPPPEQSAKNALQEYCFDKKRRLGAPVYKILLERGPDHKKEYEVGCYIGDKLYGKGVGKNRKIADALAAEAALLALRKEGQKTEKNSTESKEQFTKSKPATKKKSNTPPSFDNISDAADKLKKHALDKGVSAPLYRDVGDANDKDFAVECRYQGLATVGRNETRRSARDTAAYKMLSLLLEKEAKKAKSTQRKTPHTAKPTKRKSKREVVK